MLVPAPELAGALRVGSCLQCVGLVGVGALARVGYLVGVGRPLCEVVGEVWLWESLEGSMHD